MFRCRVRSVPSEKVARLPTAAPPSLKRPPYVSPPNPRYNPTSGDRPMRHAISLVALTLPILTCAADVPRTPNLPDTMYQNPILHADYSDPDVIRVDDDYYMTASS